MVMEVSNNLFSVGFVLNVIIHKWVHELLYVSIVSLNFALCYYWVLEHSLVKMCYILSIIIRSYVT